MPLAARFCSLNDLLHPCCPFGLAGALPLAVPLPLPLGAPLPLAGPLPLGEPFLPRVLFGIAGPCLSGPCPDDVAFGPNEPLSLNGDADSESFTCTLILFPAPLRGGRLRELILQTIFCWNSCAGTNDGCGKVSSNLYTFQPGL